MAVILHALEQDLDRLGPEVHPAVALRGQRVGLVDEQDAVERPADHAVGLDRGRTDVLPDQSRPGRPRPGGPSAAGRPPGTSRPGAAPPWSCPCPGFRGTRGAGTSPPRAGRASCGAPAPAGRRRAPAPAPSRVSSPTSASSSACTSESGRAGPGGAPNRSPSGRPRPADRAAAVDRPDGRRSRAGRRVACGWKPCREPRGHRRGESMVRARSWSSWGRSPPTARHKGTSRSGSPPSMSRRPAGVSAARRRARACRPASGWRPSRAPTRTAKARSKGASSCSSSKSSTLT